VLKIIDKRIKENLKVDELARVANYSHYHFCRIFTEVTGMSVSAYITRRKLDYALYDLWSGSKVVDVAFDYGFETHAGFTKAFKKCFGYPPSLHRLYLQTNKPKPITAADLKYGGMKLEIKIKLLPSLVVAGYASRHEIPGVNNISDIPAFWDRVNLEYGAALTTLHDTYAASQHCEIGICLDIDEEKGYFTYILGVGVDESDSTVSERPGMYKHKIKGGLYAIFTTALVAENEYAPSIRETWKQALNKWLPESEYEFDETREAYEYYDERDHYWQTDGKQQMDICIPLRRIVD